MNLIERYRQHYQGLSKTCWSGILLALLQAIVSGVFYFFSLYFVADLHYPVSVAGLIISCYGIGAVCGGYLGGKGSDLFKPRQVAIGSLILQALAIFAMGYVTSQQALMLTLFILGIGTYAFITANHLQVLLECRKTEQERLKAINILSTVSNLGLGIASVLIGTIYHIGFNKILLIFVGALLAMIAFMLSIKPEEQVDLPDTNIATTVLNNKSRRWNRYWFRAVLLCVLLAGAIVAQMSTTYPIYLQAKFPQYGVHGYSLAFLLNTLLIVVLQTPMVNMLIGRNKIIVMGVGSFLLGLGMLILNFSGFYILVLLACAIYTIGEMIFFSMAQLNCYQGAPLRKRGRNLGLYRMTFAASRVAGPFAGGVLYQHMGATAVWYACGFAGILCFVICGLFVDQ